LENCPPSLQILAVQYTGVPEGNVNIMGGHTIGHSKQKSIYVHVSYSERFPRQSYFTDKEFGFSTQYCSSFPPYCAPLHFCLWSWM